MKHTKTLALLSGSIVLISTLSACQSTTQKTDQTRAQHGHQYGGEHRQRMTVEQKQQWQQQRQQACAGKSVGERVELTQGHRNKVGQCQVMLQLDDTSKALLQQKWSATAHPSRQDFNQMNAEQRELIKQQYKTKRTEHQALRQQLQAACQGQSIGKTVQVQYDEQKLNGQCVLNFQADHSRTMHRA